MPRDLFAEVRPPSRRRSRRTVVAFSVIGHVVVLSTLLVAQVLAVGPLPQPPLPNFEWVPAQIADIVLPAPVPREPITNPPLEGVVEDPNLPPRDPPTGIAPETGLESLHQNPIPGVVPGIPTGGLEDLSTVGSTSAPPPPAVPQPMRVHVGMVPPRKTVDALPEYPPLARAARVEGIVIIEATIDTSGNVIDARALRSIAMLDQAAVAAVRQWKYTPALLNGLPVPVIITVTVNFRLQ